MRKLGVHTIHLGAGQYRSLHALESFDDLRKKSTIISRFRKFQSFFRRMVTTWIYNNVRYVILGHRWTQPRNAKMTLVIVIRLKNTVYYYSIGSKLNRVCYCFMRLEDHNFIVAQPNLWNVSITKFYNHYDFNLVQWHSYHWGHYSKSRSGQIAVAWR